MNLKASILLGLALSSTQVLAIQKNSIPKQVVSFEQKISIENIDYQLLKVDSDKFGQIAYYKQIDGLGSTSIRKTNDGKRLSYLNDARDAYYSMTRNEQPSFSKAPLLPEVKSRLHTPTLQLQQSIKTLAKQALSTSRSASDESFIIDDNEISITVVAEHTTLKEMWMREPVWGMSPDLQIVAGIDLANLTLLNSGITEFSFKLNEIVYLNQWQDVGDFETTTNGDSDSTDSNLALAMGKGNADRIIFLAPEKLMGFFLGLAPQWKFTDDDANSGVLYANQSDYGRSFYHRTVSIGATTVPIKTIAHELGHTMGLGHEREIQGATYDFALPYGYTTSNSAATTMSYGVSCDPYCKTRPDIFSNPDILNDGEPLGLPASDVNAADATRFLKKTWPLTSHVDFDLLNINQFDTDEAGNALANKTRLSWDLPVGISAQKVYITENECGSLPKLPSEDQSSTTLLVDTNVNSVTFDKKPLAQCATLMGEYHHQNTLVTRPLGMRTISSDITGQRTVNVIQQVYSVSDFGETISIPFTTEDENLTSESFLIQTPSVRGEVNRWWSIWHSEITQTIFNDFITASLTGSGNVRTLELTFSDNIADYDRLLRQMPYDAFATKRLPMSIKVANRFDGETYFDLDIRQLFAKIPTITLEKSSVLFKHNDNDSKTITALLSNVKSSDEIVVTPSVMDPNSSWTLESTEIEPLGDSTYRVSISAKRPEEATSEHAAKIAIKNTPIQAFANFINADFTYVQFEQALYSVKQGEEFTVTGTVYNLPEDAGKWQDLNTEIRASDGSVRSVAATTYENVDANTTKFILSVKALKIGSFDVPISYINQGSGYTVGKLTLEIIQDKTDSDGDGMDDGWERVHQLNLDFNDAGYDNDNDGLSNLEEYIADTDPGSKDSDMDGINDGDEIISGTDPLDAFSFLPEVKNTLGTDSDSDGDGKADIVWRNSQDGRNWLWTMSGRSVVKSAALAAIADSAWQMVGRGDFNADGKSDILWRNNRTGLNYIWLMDGFTLIERKAINTVADLNWQIKAVADFNGDNNSDILWHHQKTGQTYVYLMDGFQIKARSSVRYVGDVNWQIQATTDVNADGKSDVIWRHQRTGANYIWLMDGYTLEQGYVLNTVAGAWDIVGAGDLNGDGHGDLVWRNSIDGRNWAYLMKDGHIETSRQINTVKGAEWQIKSVADFDGDGKTDIFWHNQSTGLTYVYLMDGAAISDRGALNKVSSDWQVIGK